MKNVINKIFSGQVDEEVHSDFVKFSRGVFENRYLIEGKKQAARWSIKTSAEFANYLVRRCLEKASGSLRIKGAIICTFGLDGKTSFEFEKVKQFAGVKQHLLDTDADVKEMLRLMDEYPRAFFAISLTTDSCELKIKAKAPKSGKPGKKGEDGPKADFCALKTTDRASVEDLFFDAVKSPTPISRTPESPKNKLELSGFPDFKEIKVRHTIEIEKIDIPSGVKDPVEMREKSVRRGVVKRFVVIDGKEISNEKAFVA